jgi:hypothetical protein
MVGDCNERAEDVGLLVKNVGEKARKVGGYVLNGGEMGVVFGVNWVFVGE